MARLSFLVLIKGLGAAPIKAPFDHCVILFCSNKKRLPTLELFFKGAYIGIVIIIIIVVIIIIAVVIIIIDIQ